MLDTHFTFFFTLQLVVSVQRPLFRNQRKRQVADVQARKQVHLRPLLGLLPVPSQSGRHSRLHRQPGPRGVPKVERQILVQRGNNHRLLLKRPKKS